jgi:hypothetical protein
MSEKDIQEGCMEDKRKSKVSSFAMQDIQARCNDRAFKIMNSLNTKGMKKDWNKSNV